MSEFIPVSFRFSKEMRQRLKECSERLGWTLIGWVVALVWSLLVEPETKGTR